MGNIDTGDFQQVFLPGFRYIFVLGFWSIAAEKRSAQGDIVIAVSVGQKAIVTNLDEAGGEYMEEESTDKFFGGQGHDFLLVAIGVVPPAEGNPALFQSQDTLIADGYPVGIAAEVVKNSLGPIKRGLGIDDPWFQIKGP